MEFIFNDKTNKERRRALRKNQTDTEKMLWQYLRNKQRGGLKFFRQYGEGGIFKKFQDKDR